MSSPKWSRKTEAFSSFPKSTSNTQITRLKKASTHLSMIQNEDSYFKHVFHFIYFYRNEEVPKNNSSKFKTTHLFTDCVLMRKAELFGWERAAKVQRAEICMNTSGMEEIIQAITSSQALFVDPEKGFIECS